ncbi:hypothetical protein RJ55_05986 [Drechmeria coniospora]|nr:hypothetical protein RJ55_05986 [Drechmeria coniospora]
MASSLPFIPRVVFTVIEPVSLLAGFVGAVHDPAWFVAEQVPQAIPPPAAASFVPVSSLVIGWQLGNMYLLVGLVGLAVLLSTSEVKVVRNYLVALWIGDIGHVAASCYGLGRERLVHPSTWNAMAWGNIAVTVGSTHLFLSPCPPP